jgi:hypothetical protein
MQSGAVLAMIAVAACSRSSDVAPPSNHGSSVDVAVPPAQPQEGVFEGTISGHHFSITIPEGKLANAERGAYTWHVGSGRLAVQDSGPIADETKFLVARSPRTIVRDNDGLWIVTEVVKTAGGRVFTCLHQQTIARDGSVEAKQAAARGVAACSSLVVDP